MPERRGGGACELDVGCAIHGPMDIGSYELRNEGHPPVKGSGESADDVANARPRPGATS